MTPACAAVLGLPCFALFVGEVIAESVLKRTLTGIEER